MARISVTNTTLRFRNRIFFAREPAHQQASTKNGRMMYVVPFVNIASPAASPMPIVFNQLASSFQANRNATVVTIQKEVEYVVIGPEASKIPSGMVIDNTAARACARLLPPSSFTM